MLDMSAYFREIFSLNLGISTEQSGNWTLLTYIPEGVDLALVWMEPRSSILSASRPRRRSWLSSFELKGRAVELGGASNLKPMGKGLVGWAGETRL